MAAQKDTLVYMATNNCARISFFVKANKLDDFVELVSPQDFGGLRSERFLAINPQGKFPVLIVGGAAAAATAGDCGGPLCIYESQVILEYIADKHRDKLLLGNPAVFEKQLNVEQRAFARLLTQVHDIYIGSPNAAQAGFCATQGILYKTDMLPQERLARACDLWPQLDALEKIMENAAKGTEAESDPSKTTFAVGNVCTLADFTLYATFVWLEALVPRTLGGCAAELAAAKPSLQNVNWNDIFQGRERSRSFYNHGHGVFDQTIVNDIREGFIVALFGKRPEEIAASFREALVAMMATAGTTSESAA